MRGPVDVATNTVRGTITDNLGGYTGTFTGVLYGPERNELAIRFSMSRPADGGRVLTGLIIAAPR
jgi:hypothetical protein